MSASKAQTLAPSGPKVLVLEDEMIMEFVPLVWEILCFVVKVGHSLYSSIFPSPSAPIVQ